MEPHQLQAQASLYLRRRQRRALFELALQARLVQASPRSLRPLACTCAAPLSELWAMRSSRRSGGGRRQQELEVLLQSAATACHLSRSQTARVLACGRSKLQCSQWIPLHLAAAALFWAIKPA